MKRLLSLLLALLLLCGCGGTVSRNAPSVYRVISPEYRTHGSLLLAESVQLQDGEDELQAVLRALGGASADSRVYNPLSGISVLDCRTRDNLAILSLSEEYLALDGYAKTLADACCAMSLCSLSGIDRVSIAVGNIVITSGLTEEDIYQESDEALPANRQVCLYFTDDSGEKLIPEYRSISSDSSERYVVEELIRAGNGRTSPLPQGTELLGVTRKGQSCTLNLSKEFLENKPESATGELITLYALVNSLATLGSISEVSITVEGKSVERYVNLSLSSPLSPLPFIPIDDLPRQTGFCKLYFASGDSLVGIPCVAETGSALKQNLLDYLMGSGNTGIYSSLFSEMDELQHISTVSGVCRITVSRSFFERRSPDKALLALDALALTLLELEDVGSVVVSYPDGSTPKMPGIDLSRPILNIDADILK